MWRFLIVLSILELHSYFISDVGGLCLSRVNFIDISLKNQLLFHWLFCKTSLLPCFHFHCYPLLVLFSWWYWVDFLLASFLADDLRLLIWGIFFSCQPLLHCFSWGPHLSLCSDCIWSRGLFGNMLFTFRVFWDFFFFFFFFGISASQWMHHMISAILYSDFFLLQEEMVCLA